MNCKQPHATSNTLPRQPGNGDACSATLLDLTAGLALLRASSGTSGGDCAHQQRSSGNRRWGNATMRARRVWKDLTPVSYTHLTLPTICSV
eukprot:7674928-Alexandrium_andersonii.AAC.1